MLLLFFHRNDDGDRLDGSLNLLPCVGVFVLVRDLHSPDQSVRLALEHFSDPPELVGGPDTGVLDQTDVTLLDIPMSLQPLMRRN